MWLVIVIIFLGWLLKPGKDKKIAPENKIKTDNVKIQKAERTMKNIGFTKREKSSKELKELKNRWRLMKFVYFPILFLSGFFVPPLFLISIIWLSVKYVFIKKRIDHLEKEEQL